MVTELVQYCYQVSIRIFKSLSLYKSSKWYDLHLVSFVWMEGQGCVLLELQVNYLSQI